jgi:hypothetical protein
VEEMSTFEGDFCGKPWVESRLDNLGARTVYGTHAFAVHATFPLTKGRAGEE